MKKTFFQKVKGLFVLKKYWISYVGEYTLLPNVMNGRLEIYKFDKPYAIEEIRIHTEKVREFNSFISKYDLKDFSKNGLNKIIKYIKINFKPDE